MPITNVIDLSSVALVQDDAQITRDTVERLYRDKLGVELQGNSSIKKLLALLPKLEEANETVILSGLPNVPTRIYRRRFLGDSAITAYSRANAIALASVAFKDYVSLAEIAGLDAQTLTSILIGFSE